MKILLYILLALLIIAGVLYYFTVLQSAVGRLPTGERLKRVQASPNYHNGSFRNLSATPELTNNATYGSMLRDMLFNPNKRTTPKNQLPALKTDLHNLPADEDVFIWLGHASYFMRLDGASYLVDPVLSGRASPIPFTIGSYTGTDPYTVADLPEIDYLLITHDHWDHIDYPVIAQLKGKVKRIITGLGTGEHFVAWGYPDNLITELDWYDEIELDTGVRLTATPARHFSGRGFSRNQSLWLSFVLITPNRKLFLGGDSGYDNHFAQIGQKYGPFDLAILENGQYNKSWANIHSLPHETAQAARELNTRAMVAVHWGKFTLALHNWDEPIEQLIQARRDGDPELLTPMIGEPVFLGQNQEFSQWWRNVPHP